MGQGRRYELTSRDKGLPKDPMKDALGENKDAIQ